MATEVLYVPEEHLREVIAVIRWGLCSSDVSEVVAEHLTQWCDEEEEYITR